MDTLRFGTNYGGFNYPRDILTRLNESSIVYCVGAGEDISHDVQLAHTFGCTVHIFDPTPRAIQHVEDVKKSYESGISLTPSKRYGGNDPTYTHKIMENRVNPDKIQMHNFGINSASGSFDFYMPENPEYVSCSILQRLKGKSHIRVEMKRLSETMKMLGHSKIDLLKMDIEGAECDVIDDMLNESILPTYLAVDFDLSVTGNKEDRDRCEAVIKRLDSVGYMVVRRKGQDISFVLRN